jgi:hypothetical protein
MAPDLFSSMALRSLSRTLPKWAEWGKKAANNSLLKEADYPFPDARPKYLGSTVQNFRKRSRGDEEAKPTKAFQQWFDRLAETRENDLLEALKKADMLLPECSYKAANAPTNEFLMEIASLDGLIATAQQLSKPVFAIDLETDTNHTGVIAGNYHHKIKDVETAFRQGAEKVVALTGSL